MKKYILFLMIACCFVFVLTGCTKDEIVNHYNEALQEAGDDNLTKDSKLQGKRSFGSDSYVGNYSADYDSFTGTETLFGGTALERNDGNEIKVTCTLNITDGTAKVVFKSGTDDPQVLIESSGDYSETIELPSASNYIAVEGDGFTGSVELEIK
ncbi:hypothetical protein [Clostridium kluyveri]|uniref:Lipoprotein n=2 Tax=Clostridium kluyveri TaxID=1534 RepID=A5N3Y0_CLOK5|nr:hypothetical protein [Clostridium kluyveri]EDK35826.1 Hypothetical protein CKL_3849 [Clostridium kluyveri DSM 555]BAH08448.1 hypothetical protein CKR_3397 [Clostridium kluyveri NBRC 12016]